MANMNDEQRDAFTKALSGAIDEMVRLHPDGFTVAQLRDHLEEAYHITKGYASPQRVTAWVSRQVIAGKLSSKRAAGETVNHYFPHKEEDEMAKKPHIPPEELEGGRNGSNKIDLPSPENGTEPTPDEQPLTNEERQNMMSHCIAYWHRLDEHAPEAIPEELRFGSRGIQRSSLEELTDEQLQKLESVLTAQCNNHAPFVDRRVAAIVARGIEQVPEEKFTEDQKDFVDRLRKIATYRDKVTLIRRLSREEAAALGELAQQERKTREVEKAKNFLSRSQPQPKSPQPPLEEPNVRPDDSGPAEPVPEPVSAEEGNPPADAGEGAQPPEAAEPPPEPAVPPVPPTEPASPPVAEIPSANGSDKVIEGLRRDVERLNRDLSAATAKADSLEQQLQAQAKGEPMAEEKPGTEASDPATKTPPEKADQVFRLVKQAQEHDYLALTDVIVSKRELENKPLAYTEDLEKRAQEVLKGSRREVKADQPAPAPAKPDVEQPKAARWAFLQRARITMPRWAVITLAILVAIAAFTAINPQARRSFLYSIGRYDIGESQPTEGAAPTQPQIAPQSAEQVEELNKMLRQLRGEEEPVQPPAGNQ